MTLTRGGFDARPTRVESRQAMPQYVTITQRFFVGPLRAMDEYAGPVVAGAEGLYLVFNERQISRAVSDLQSRAADLAGPFGQRLSHPHAPSLTCERVWRGPYTDLPDAVTRHPDWPRLTRPVRDAWLVPAEAIDAIGVSIWTGLRVRVGEAHYVAAVGPFACGRARRALGELGLMRRGAGAAGEVR